MIRERCATLKMSPQMGRATLRHLSDRWRRKRPNKTTWFEILLGVCATCATFFLTSRGEAQVYAFKGVIQFMSKSHPESIGGGAAPLKQLPVRCREKVAQVAQSTLAGLTANPQNQGAR